MAELFWLISPEARVKLIQLQADRHKDKPTLEMAARKAPWELKVPKPAIPARTDMNDNELDKFMRSKPKGGARG